MSTIIDGLRVLYAGDGDKAGEPLNVAMARFVDAVMARYAAREIRALAPAFCYYCRTGTAGELDDRNGIWTHRLRYSREDWDDTLCQAAALHTRAWEIEHDSPHA